MGFNREIDIGEWHKIGDKLTEFFGICSCQRKLKTIIEGLVSIKEKCLKKDYSFSGAEWLVLVQMEKHSSAVCHGVNCEFPIINENDHFGFGLMRLKTIQT